MKRLRHHLVGIQQGNIVMFSDFENDGVMWSGEGPRQKRVGIRFDAPFSAAPAVHVSVSMWDTDRATNQRGDLMAEAITADGFELVFRTWGDSRVARLRADWMAIGEVPDDDDWTLY